MLCNSQFQMGLLLLVYYTEKGFAVPYLCQFPNRSPRSRILYNLIHMNVASTLGAKLA
jgi:hypothetical protein